MSSSRRLPTPEWQEFNVADTLTASSKSGYVYLIHAVGTDKFKIGKSRISVARRIADLQTGCPLRLRYVYHAYVDNVDGAEKQLHLYFEHFRSIGEWFSLTFASVKECITLMRLAQIEQPDPFMLKVKEAKKEFENLSNAERELLIAERVSVLREKGWAKRKIINAVWGVTVGGSQKYKNAESEYRRLISEQSQCINGSEGSIFSDASSVTTGGRE